MSDMNPSAEPPASQIPAPSSAAMDVPRRRSGWRLSIFLFLITCVTTILTGIGWEAGARGVAIAGPMQILGDPSLLFL
ncbi:MAG: hypothetical protein HY049_16410, partial [Acidobacteria bacterium]|nr:hypothetical protein [Acidobacteriota bacterium]